MRVPNGLNDTAVQSVLIVLKKIQPANYYRIDRSCIMSKYDDIMPMAGIKIGQDNGLVEYNEDGYSLSLSGEKYVSSLFCELGTQIKCDDNLKVRLAIEAIEFSDSISLAIRKKT